jgi:hypothetical protein
MIGNKSFITLSLAAALGVLGVASATASDHGHGGRGGFVVPAAWTASIRPIIRRLVTWRPPHRMASSYQRMGPGTCDQIGAVMQ